MKRKARILIVDDEPDIRRALKRVLKSNFEVLTASDGVEGLDIAHKEIIDLMIVDAVMPRLDGFAVVSRMREEAMTRDIPILMLTGLADKNNQIEGYDSGADMYMTKPFDFDELWLRARRLMELGKRPYVEASLCKFWTAV